MEFDDSELPTLSVAQFFGSATFLEWFSARMVVQTVCLFLCRQPGSPFRERATFAANKLEQVVPLTYLACRGTYMWFFDTAFAAAFANDHLFGYYEPARALVQVMATHAFFDVCTPLFCEDLRRPDFLIHHIMALILGLHSATTLCCNYYGIFFMGVAEISSVLIGFVTLFRSFPKFQAAFPVTGLLVQNLFAVLFLPLRCFYWIFVTADFWVTLWQRSSRPLPQMVLWVRVVWLVISVALLLIQLFWGVKVVKAWLHVFRGWRGKRRATSSSNV
mmetsp:Transcript_18223/g.48960  ORF Transcript_18223/g.48960 Transcript_18223/m.48960 type:complete len:275 (-) Transcript_18223:165-989(-)